MKPGDPVAPAPDEAGDAADSPDREPVPQTEPQPETQPETQSRVGWPAFARRYPEDAKLERLVLAFARGNFALVRRDALPLAERAQNREVAAAVRDLRGRIEPSRLASYLLALGVALMLFLYFFYARLRG